MLTKSTNTFKFFSLFTLICSSQLVFATPQELICKKLGNESVFNETKQKIYIRNEAGQLIPIYGVVAASELRFVKTVQIPAGLKGENLKDGECSFKTAGFPVGVSSARLIIKAGTAYNIQTMKNSAGTINVNFGAPTYGGLCCSTLLFKVDARASGTAYIVEASGDDAPVIP